MRLRTIIPCSPVVETIKKSTFLTSGYSVSRADDVKSIVREVLPTLEQYQHTCYGWRGSDENQFRVFDADEPSGTAGRPILSSIESLDLFNTLIVVQRNFGGVKLGIGGLQRAYGGCARSYLSSCERVDVVEERTIRVTLPSQWTNKLISAVERLNREEGVGGGGGVRYSISRSGGGSDGDNTISIALTVEKGGRGEERLVRYLNNNITSGIDIKWGFVEEGLPE